jgi:hypothetical protein
MKFSHRARAWLAYILSFFKKNWQLRDYPIRYMPQTTTGPDRPERLRVLPWRADILCWYLAGSGNTRDEAYADLESRFAAASKIRTSMPRPGKSVPIAFASDEKISAHPDLREDFVNKVLELKWAFLSDESALWDFHEENDNAVLIQKIGHVYGVDVSHITSGNVAEILEEIANQIGRFPEDPILKAIRLDREARMRHIAGLPPQPWNTASEVNDNH